MRLNGMRLNLALLLEHHPTPHTLWSWTCPLIISVCTGIDDNVPLDLVIAKTVPNLPGAISLRGPESHPVGMGRLILDRIVECLESQAGKAVLVQQHAMCFLWKLISVVHQSYSSNIIYLTSVLLMTAWYFWALPTRKLFPFRIHTLIDACV